MGVLGLPAVLLFLRPGQWSSAGFGSPAIRLFCDYYLFSALSLSAGNDGGALVVGEGNCLR